MRRLPDWLIYFLVLSVVLIVLFRTGERAPAPVRPWSGLARTRRIGENSRTFVQQQYDNKVLVNDLLKFYQSLLT